ncbi:hypothetical protein J6590_035448 [Homalodisca vitripennis]|nr:hypothetical protein J6590_035448 [Homalodisca vitripennis]
MRTIRQLRNKILSLRSETEVICQRRIIKENSGFSKGTDAVHTVEMYAQRRGVTADIYMMTRQKRCSVDDVIPKCGNEWIELEQQLRPHSGKLASQLVYHHHSSDDVTAHHDVVRNNLRANVIVIFFL